MTSKNCVQRLVSVVLLTLLCIGIANADGVVKGRIIDQNNRPVEFATAALLNAKTKIPVKGSESNSAGEFVIDKVTPGEYVLSVTLVGYNKFETEKFASRDKVVEKNVMLHEATQQLKEAVVVAKRKFIEQQADKMVINPEASITTASDNVFDILKKTPGVTVDNNNNISLKGKDGVKVLIDDKPTYVSADQLVSLLKGMQGKDIDRIEIIENPSSRYDAEGNSGIINIKTKHEKRTGINGSFFTGLSYSSNLSENTGFNLNVNLGKLNVYGNYSFYEWRGWNDMYATRRFVTGTNTGAFEQLASHETYHGNGHNFKVGADYYLTKKQVISVMMRSSHGFNHNNGLNTTAFQNSSHQVDSTLMTDSKNNNYWHNYTYNANYKWDIDTTGRYLSIDADYALFNSGSTSDQTGQYFNGAGKNMNINSHISGNQPGSIHIFTVKSDYVHPLNKMFSLEAGVKTSFVNNNSQADFVVVDPTAMVWNTGLKPHDQFIYKENINAAYANAHGKFGKTSVQLGLRLENTNSKGDSQSMNRIDTKHYTDLFPSLFVQQALNDNNQFGFSYSYRIGRPSYRILNPFMWMLDQYTYNQGNPFLRPQFTHSLGLNYTYKSKFITSIGYNSTHDLFTQVLKQNDETKVMFQTNENLGKSIDLNGSQTMQLDLTKWWHINATATVMHKKVTTDTNVFSLWSYTGNMTQSFSLPYDIGLELSGRYRSKQLWGNFTGYEQYSMDFGVQKALFNKKGTLKLSLNDVFNTNKGGGYAKYSNVDLMVHNRWDSRELNVSFTYRFGSETFKTRSNRSTASSEEQSRSDNGK